jgi:septal ring factor EnvC (AmiA/AmiB activator)
MTSNDDQRLFDFFTLNSCISQERKLFYIATPKVACTSLKWWFAELEGVAEDVRQLKTSSESDPELVIHDSLRVVAPQTCLHSPEQLQEIKADGYFSFALVRNPYKRVFSAWQSKILLREPLQIGPYLGQAFVEFAIETMNDVAAAFECFLEYLNTYEIDDFKDWHWTPQYDLLQPQLFPYTVVSKIEDTSRLNDALRTQLGDAYVNPFTTSRANESLIPYLPEFISSRSKELIDRLYAKDFETYGYQQKLPPAKEKFSQAHLTLALKGIDLLRGRHLRIGEMRLSNNAQFSALLKDKEWLAEQRKIWMSVCREKEAELVNLQSYCAGEVEKLEAAHAELEQLRPELTQSNVSLAHSNAELQQSNSELQRSNAELAQVTAELTKSSGELAHTKAELTQSGSRLAQVEAELAHSGGELAHAQAELTQFGSELAQVQAELAQSGSELAQVHAELAQSGSELAQSNAELASSNSELAQSSAALAHSNAELQRSNEELARLNVKLARSDSDLAQANLELAKSQLELLHTNKDLAELNAHLEWSTAALQETRDYVASLTSELEAHALKHRRYLSVYRFFESGLVNRLRRAGQFLKGRKGE